jgi:hypothetical protein
MDKLKRKLVVKIKAKPEEPKPETAKQRHKRIFAQKRAEMKARGLKYFSFVWPENLVNNLMQILPGDTKANDYIRSLIEAEIERCKKTTGDPHEHLSQG